MPNRWIVGIDPEDTLEQGYVIHREAPGFIAKWKIEGADEGTISELVYTDADDENAVAIYDFEWTDAEPTQKLFRSVMAEAIEQIDEFLSITNGMKE